MAETPTRSHLPFLPFMMILIVALVVVMALAPLVGPSKISLAGLFDKSIPPEENTDRLIFFTIRLPRMLMGLVAGSALAMAGAVFQALLRNDLATPYTLGVSGGAAFGALLAFHVAAVMVPVAALLGAGFSVTMILLLASRGTGHDRIGTLLLAGVTMNLVFGAGIQVVQYVASPYEVFSMVRWMMGGLDVAHLSTPLLLLVPVAVGLAILMSQAQSLNVMTLGDSTASHLGFNPNQQRMICIITASVMTALVVAVAGPVGFVGLIVPHAIRRLVGQDHRKLLPASFLAGATFLILCDTVARVIGGNTELPVGIVTASLGGPFFLWILFRRGIYGER